MAENDKPSNREKIIETALKSLAKEKISDITMREIARGAEISPGTLTYYFPSKNELLLTLLDQLDHIFNDQRDSDFKELELSPSEKLRSFFVKQLDHNENKITEVFFDFWGQGKKDPVFREKIQGMYTKWRSAIQAVIQEGIEHGDFDPGHTKFLPALIVSIIEGASLQYLIDEDALNLEKYFEFTIEIIIEALQKNKREPYPSDLSDDQWQAISNFFQEPSAVGRPREIEPNLIEAYINLGASLLQVEQPEESIAVFSQSLTLSPNNPDALYNRGNVYLTLNQPEQAIKDFDTLIELYPENFLAYFRRGIALTALGNLEQAIADYETTINLQPDFADPYNLLASLNFQKDDYETAIENWEMVNQLAPDFPDAYYNLGVVYNTLQAYDKAIEYFDKTLELNEAYTDAYLARANIYAFQRDFEPALADYDKVVEIDPEFGQAYYNRGIVYYNNGKVTLALEDFRKVLEVSEDAKLIADATNAIIALGAKP